MTTVFFSVHQGAGLIAVLVVLLPVALSIDEAVDLSVGPKYPPVVSVIARTPQSQSTL